MFNDPEPGLKRELLYFSFGMLFFAVASFIFLYIWNPIELPEGLKTVLIGLVTTLLLYIKEILGFEFGSSKSSERKDAVIATAAGSPQSPDAVVAAIKDAEPIQTVETKP